MVGSRAAARRSRSGPGSAPALRGPTWIMPIVDAGDAAAAGAYFQKLHRRDVERKTAELAIVYRADLEFRRDGGFAVVDRSHLRGGAPHVEGQHVIETFFAADDAAHQHTCGRSRFHDAHGVFLGQIRRYQTAVGLHDEEVRFDVGGPEGILEIGQIAFDDRLDISIGDRCADPLVFANLRRDLGRQGNTHPGRSLQHPRGHGFLMGGIGVGV